MDEQKAALLRTLNQAVNCGMKVRFESEWHAVKGAKTASKEHGSVLSVYRCDHCFWWHMTTDKRHREGR